jgi:hypothetical protein
MENGIEHASLRGETILDEVCDRLLLRIFLRLANVWTGSRFCAHIRKAMIILEGNRSSV